MRELLSTMRVQLHQGFGFDAAAEQVAYVASLGVSHLYLSPIGTSVAGSTHGYDVVDPTRVNPELGGEEGLRRLVSSLHQHGMGAIVDIVPNHMAASVENPWWRDLLANGMHSAYASYFDVDWNAPRAGGKAWLPVLECSREDAVVAGKLQLQPADRNGEPVLSCSGMPLPLSDASIAKLLASMGIVIAEGTPRAALLSRWAQARQTPQESAAIDDVMAKINNHSQSLVAYIEQQNYRLADWHSGNDVINYRRFFDISSLVAVAVEHDAVFDAVHALPLRLVSEGLIDGLRLDHIDGLSFPAAYLKKLRSAVDNAALLRPADGLASVTIHVEKILASDEALCPTWPVAGTTGYEFMDLASGVLHSADGELPLQRAWAAASGSVDDFGQEELRARQQTLAAGLRPELAATVRAWTAAMPSRPNDMTVEDAASRLLKNMPVYRTYLEDSAYGDHDRAVLERAAKHAAQNSAGGELLPWIEWLTNASDDPQQAERMRLARRRFEQTAAPLNAKSIEDTVFYRYGPLLSRNEVGSDPRHFAIPLQDFHRAMQQRQRAWPGALSATATHDHKRGEDVRARLAVLSEQAETFVSRAALWSESARVNAGDHSDILGGDLWMLLQTLISAWPLELELDDDKGMHAFLVRLKGWQKKALREAKLRTSWNAPDENYENACAALLDEWFSSSAHRGMMHELRSSAREMDLPGALNGLSMTALRLTAPGVPDLYQGTEFWDQSLVDPDNRRPVDYAARRQALQADESLDALLRGYRDGRIKQHVIATLLQLRRKYPAVFLRGDYQPLIVTGKFSDRVIAFMRQHEGTRCLVVVPRLCADWLNASSSPLVAAADWDDTAVELQGDDVNCTYDDVFMPHQRHTTGSFALKALLGRWPVAVLFSHLAGAEQHEFRT